MKSEKRPVGYWNPKLETMPRDQLDALRLWKLQRFAAFAYMHSPYWTHRFDEAGLKPDQIRSLDDIRRIPVLTKADLLAAQAQHPPYGDFSTAPLDRVSTYHQTSGTSGKQPLRIPDSLKDWEWTAEMWCISLYGFGVRTSDIVYLAFAYGAFIGFWGAHYGAQKVGAMTVAGGGAPTDVRIRQILDLGATVVACTPTYGVRLAQTAREMGIDLARDSRVELTIHAGEPGASILATRSFLEEAWGARAGDFAGLSESGTNHCFTCSEQSGGLHLIEDHYIHEVVDPRTLEPVGYGERGELVLTSFGRGLLPLLRYRTGDLVERVPASACTCGRTLDLFQGGVLGRADDMRVIRGVNIYPSAVENIVREFKEFDEFQLVFERPELIDEVSVRVETSAGVGEEIRANLLLVLARRLAEAHEGLRINVDWVEPGTLPRFELKARRLIDKRPAR